VKNEKKKEKRKKKMLNKSRFVITGFFLNEY